MRIHTFQIAVPLGDSAIHLLVKGESAPYEIQSAVLIDGGRRGRKVVKKIKDVIQWIETGKQYTFASNAFFENPIENAAANPPITNLRFDSIVITHWDLDHYDGVLGLLTDGFDRTWTRLAELGTDARFQKAPSSYYAVQIPNWYCKYDRQNLTMNAWEQSTLPTETALNTAAKSTHKTTIYVPYSISNVKPGKEVKNKTTVYTGRSGPFGVQGTRSRFLIRGLYNTTAPPVETLLLASLGFR